MAEDIQVQPLKKDGLYKQYTVTDGLAGSILVSEPVQLVAGNLEPDVSRPTLFGGNTHIIVGTPNGPQQIPFNFPIEALNVEEAIDRFGEYLKVAIKKLQDAQLRQSIATPGGVPSSVLDLSRDLNHAKNNQGPRGRWNR